MHLFKQQPILLAILTAFTLNGCKHDDHDHSDSKPAIRFISPAEGASYNEGDTLWLRVNMKSEEDLHDYSLEVKNITDGISEYLYNGHSHNKELTTALSFIPRVNANSTMQLVVINKDHDGKVQQQTLTTFTVNNVSNTQIPVINLISPTPTANFQNGSTMRIQGNFTHNNKLKEANILLKKDGVTVLNYTPIMGSVQLFSFDTLHRIQTTGHADYDLTITVKDMDNNNNSRTMSFHVH